MKEKSTQKVDLKRSRSGGNLEFDTVEGSFGGINRKLQHAEYIYGVIPLKIIELG